MFKSIILIVGILACSIGLAYADHDSFLLGVGLGLTDSTVLELNIENGN